MTLHIHGLSMGFNILLTILKFIFVICFKALNPHSPLSSSNSMTFETKSLVQKRSKEQ